MFSKKEAKSQQPAAAVESPPAQSESNIAKSTEVNLPCEHYQYEMKKTCGVFAKIAQDFVEPSTHDCLYWQDMFFSCQKYKQDPSRNFDCFMKLKTYEASLIKKRTSSIEQNNVWQLRTEPPSDWNAALPDWCQQRLHDSYWYKTSQEKKQS